LKCIDFKKASSYNKLAKDKIKTCGRVALLLHAFLTSALNGGEWSASLSGLFTRWERNPGTHLVGNCVASRAGLDAVMKKKEIRTIAGTQSGSSGL
jgi:hypothetical protein